MNPAGRSAYGDIFASHRALSARAHAVQPDGASSDSRPFAPFPVHVARAKGACKFGVNGRRFVDWWCGHGALLLGHGHPAIVEAVVGQMQRGTHFGAAHPLEIEWAEAVVGLIPAAERVRFTGSGTEAVLLALLLARAYTGRPDVVRFAGHYHGWHPAINVGSGEVGRGLPDDPRVQVCEHDLEQVAAALAGDQIAAVILEPTGPCSGVVPLGAQFVRALRALTRSHGALLIFDEIVTGFRVAPGGAQARLGIEPDLTTLAKILSGGLPGGALAGRADVMALLDKRDGGSDRPRVPHLGTYNGNPLSSAAGLAMLSEVASGDAQQQAARCADTLRRALCDVIERHGVDCAVYGESSCIKFLVGHGGRVPSGHAFDAARAPAEVLLARGDRRLTHALRRALLVRGVDLSPSSFASAAHGAREIEETVAAFDDALAAMKQRGLFGPTEPAPRPTRG